MKHRRFLISFLLLFLGWKTGAQVKIPIYKQPYKPLKEFKDDVTQYFLYNIISIKDDFVGKKASTVFDILEPDIITYLPDLSGSLAIGLGLYFKSVDTSLMKGKDKEQKELNLRISFTTSMPWDSIITFYRKNKKQWTSEEKQFYGKSIVKNIELYEISPKDGKPVLLDQ